MVINMNACKRVERVRRTMTSKLIHTDKPNPSRHAPSASHVVRISMVAGLRNAPIPWERLFFSSLLSA